jgi:16S rRNA (cytosine967-C5)-methyltransferase
MRRKPDLKYTKTEQDIMQLARIQLQILQAVEPLLKQGGTLVYSTCTIDQEENGDVIETFLENNPEFVRNDAVKELLPEKLARYLSNGEVQILPHYFGTDGFYIACLRKKG